MLFILFFILSQEDYHIALNELDEKQYVALRLTLCEMRNIYVCDHNKSY